MPRDCRLGFCQCNETVLVSTVSLLDIQGEDCKFGRLKDCGGLGGLGILVYNRATLFFEFRLNWLLKIELFLRNKNSSF